jgi:signal transduction histidine kinase
LSIAHELAVLMGGSVDFRSGAAGTTVTVALPAAASDREQDRDAVFT